MDLSLAHTNLQLAKIEAATTGKPVLLLEREDDEQTTIQTGFYNILDLRFQRQKDELDSLSGMIIVYPDGDMVSFVRGCY